MFLLLLLFNFTLHATFTISKHNTGLSKSNQEPCFPFEVITLNAFKLCYMFPSEINFSRLWDMHKIAFKDVKSIAKKSRD